MQFREFFIVNTLGYFFKVSDYEAFGSLLEVRQVFQGHVFETQEELNAYMLENHGMDWDLVEGYEIFVENNLDSEPGEQDTFGVFLNGSWTQHTHDEVIEYINSFEI